jgi:hypothetical protein
MVKLLYECRLRHFRQKNDTPTMSRIKFFVATSRVHVAKGLSFKPICHLFRQFSTGIAETDYA